MADEEPNEYTCPECGSAFREGAERCPVCDTVFDWAEETDYVCPECGSRVPHDSKDCPECGAQFVGEVGAGDRGIDAMLEAAVAETLVTPKKEEPASEWEESAPAAPAAPGGAGPASTPAGATSADAHETSRPDEAREAPGHAEAGTIAEPKRGGATKPAPGSEDVAKAAAPSRQRAAHRYPGGFTWLGILFIILAGTALALTVVALRWDAISSGSRYETIGTMQSMVIMAGIAGFIVCAFVSMWDLLRGSRPTER